MSIGKDFSNYFNTHLKNGNFAKWSNALGKTAMSIGLMSLAMKGNNGSHGCCHHNGSVFNGYMNTGCGGYVGRQFLFGGIGVSQHLLNNPMDILNTPLAYQDSFGMNSGYASNYGMLNSYMGGNFMGNNYMDPYSYPILQMMGGANIFSQNTSDAELAQYYQESTEKMKYNAEKATQTDTTQAEKLNTALGGLLDADGKADKTKDAYQFVTEDDKTGDATEKYKERLKSIGNSLVTSMDTDKDGFVSEDEYVKATGNKNASIAFKKLDANGDKKLDYRELGAQVATFDSSTSDAFKKDGQISAEDFEHWNRAMHDEKGVGFDRHYRNNLKNYFGLE